MTDLHGDGNAVAGLLGELLAVDVTTIRRTCHSCGATSVLGAHRAYTGAGVVLRCPACDDAAILIGVQEHRMVIQWRGTYSIPRAT